MAWEDTLLVASYKKIEFECFATKDDGGRRHAVHKPLFSDSVYIEDLGEDNPVFSLTAVFSGEYAESDWSALLGVLRHSEPGEFVHPFDGAMIALCVDYQRVREVERWDYIEVNLQFLEHRGGSRAETITIISHTEAIEAEVIEDVAATPTAALEGLQEQADLTQAIPDTPLAIEASLPRQLANRIREICADWRDQIGSYTGIANDLLAAPEFIGQTLDDVNGLLNTRIGLSAIGDWQTL